MSVIFPKIRFKTLFPLTGSVPSRARCLSLSCLLEVHTKISWNCRWSQACAAVSASTRRADMFPSLSVEEKIGFLRRRGRVTCRKAVVEDSSHEVRPASDQGRIHLVKQSRLWQRSVVMLTSRPVTEAPRSRQRFEPEYDVWPFNTLFATWIGN